MDAEQMIAQARQLSGESYVGARPQFPTIKFMGRGSQYGEAGKYYRLEKNKDTGNLDSALIGETCDITILRVRKMMENDGDGEQRKFVYEFDATSPSTLVTMKIGSQEPIQLTYADVKQQHPDLKYREVLYVAYAGKLHKMKVGGGSLKNLFAYLQSIPYDDTVMRYITKLGAEQVEHPKGAYFAMTFTRGEISPDFEKFFSTMQKLSFPSAPTVALPAGETAPSSSTEEEINIEDIPF